MSVPRNPTEFRQTTSYRLRRSWQRAGETSGAVLSVVLFPFRVLRTFWRAAEAAGRAIILGAFHFMLGLFGIVVVGWFCFALVRVLCHPLFQK